MARRDRGLSAADATQLINRRNALVIDLRGTDAFAQGHLPQARHLRFDELKSGEEQEHASAAGLPERRAFGQGARRAEGSRLRAGFHAARWRQRLAAGRHAGRQARSGEMSKVVMYSTQVCPYCQMAEQLLKSRGVAHIEKVLIERDPERRAEMMERTGRRTVPQVFIGDTHVGGYDELSALDRAGGLMPLLETV
ncbi:hypothetical protein DFQ30_000963 [Apophysomyces sp. BC1015]|nr:hypothetical protein DFQ30_000963 [Apophysomyces sp. BC1015]